MTLVLPKFTSAIPNPRPSYIIDPTPFIHINRLEDGYQHDPFTTSVDNTTTATTTTTIASMASSSFSAITVSDPTEVRINGTLLHKTSTNIEINKENISANENRIQEEERKQNGRSVDFLTTVAKKGHSSSEQVKEDGKSAISSSCSKRRFGTTINPNCSKPKTTNNSSRKQRKKKLITGEYSASVNHPILVVPAKNPIIISV